VRVAKILRAEIEFRAKKKKLDLVFKRFEVRSFCLDVYDLFCRSFSKRNDVVFIEKDERTSAKPETSWGRRKPASAVQSRQSSQSQSQLSGTRKRLSIDNSQMINF
jgi:hypothetical protein